MSNKIVIQNQGFTNIAKQVKYEIILKGRKQTTKNTYINKPNNLNMNINKTYNSKLHFQWKTIIVKNNLNLRSP